MKIPAQKFIVGVLALGGAFALAFLGKLSPEYSTVATVVVVAFSGANAYITGKTVSAKPATTGSSPMEG